MNDLNDSKTANHNDIVAPFDTLRDTRERKKIKFSVQMEDETQWNQLNEIRQPAGTMSGARECVRLRKLKYCGEWDVGRHPVCLGPGWLWLRSHFVLSSYSQVIYDKLPNAHARELRKSEPKIK